MIEQILTYFELELVILIIFSNACFFHFVKVETRKPLVTFLVSIVVGFAYYYYQEITWVKWLSSFGLATSIYDIVIKELLDTIKTRYLNNPTI